MMMEKCRTPLEVPSSELAVFRPCTSSGECASAAFRQAEALGDVCMGRAAPGHSAGAFVLHHQGSTPISLLI